MRRALRVGLWVFLALALTVGAYVAYVLLSYYRVEDNLPLEVSMAAETERETLAAGAPCRAVSYNIGFGAYSADYSFFMDGGRESRARSAEAVYENVGGAMAAARDLSPDFLLLQEVDVDGTRSHHVDELELVRTALGAGYDSTFAQNYDSPFLFWPLLEPHGANQAGQATFSRYPIASALRRQLPVEEGVMKLVDCDRCYSVQRIPVPGEAGELVLYNLHLSAYTSDGRSALRQEATGISGLKGATTASPSGTSCAGMGWAQV